MPTDQAVLETLSPEKLLVATRLRVIGAAIRMFTEAESLDPYVSHERNNRAREGILRTLQDRRNELSERSSRIPTDRKLKRYPTKATHVAQLEMIHKEYEPCLVAREFVPHWEFL